MLAVCQCLLCSVKGEFVTSGKLIVKIKCCVCWFRWNALKTGSHLLYKPLELIVRLKEFSIWKMNSIPLPDTLMSEMIIQCHCFVLVLSKNNISYYLTPTSLIQLALTWVGYYHTISAILNLKEQPNILEIFACLLKVG